MLCSNFIKLIFSGRTSFTGILYKQLPLAFIDAIYIAICWAVNGYLFIPSFEKFSLSSGFPLEIASIISLIDVLCKISFKDMLILK